MGLLPHENPVSEQARNEKVVFVLAIFKTLGTEFSPVLDGNKCIGQLSTLGALNRLVGRFHSASCQISCAKTNYYAASNHAACIVSATARKFRVASSKSGSTRFLAR